MALDCAPDEVLEKKLFFGPVRKWYYVVLATILGVLLLAILITRFYCKPGMNIP